MCVSGVSVFVIFVFDVLRIFMNVFYVFINFDQVELDKFVVFVNCWWDVDGLQKLLYVLNLVCLQYVVSCVLLCGVWVLDIGCGGGLFSEVLVKEGVEVIVIDLVLELVKVVWLYSLEFGVMVDYCLQVVEDLVVEQLGSFDVVICMEMLEYVFDLGVIIVVCYCLFKFGGQLFLFIVNCILAVFVVVIVGVEYVVWLLFKGMYYYQDFIKLAEFGKWLCEVDFILCDVSGMVYELWCNCVCLSSCIDINYLVYVVKLDDVVGV